VPSPSAMPTGLHIHRASPWQMEDLTVGDQWLDMIIDGSSQPLNLCAGRPCATKTASGTRSCLDYRRSPGNAHLDQHRLDLNAMGIQDDPAEAGCFPVPNRSDCAATEVQTTRCSPRQRHANFTRPSLLQTGWWSIESDNTRFKIPACTRLYGRRRRTDRRYCTGRERRTGKVPGAC